MYVTEEATRTEAARPEIRIGRLERDRLLTWLGLASALTLSAVLNLWDLAQNGYSNLYYSVAVQSMMQNLNNFFFASYDAGGFISVDKPPVALWLQAISAKILGFSGFALLLPEALAGIASVALIFFLVKRVFGTLAGFIAAIALAITPIAVAVQRTNNTDTLLMFTLLLAAWAITRATEKGKFWFLALGLALVGVAFNIKMLAAFIVLPAFYLLYFVAAPIKWPKRIGHLALGSVVLFTLALSWPLAVDLTPASNRPWVGGSTNNSVLQLALGYNGLGRVTGNEGTGRGGFNGRPPGGFNRGTPPGGFNNGNGSTNPGGLFNIPGLGGGQQGNPGFGGGRAFGGPGGGGMFGAGQPGPFRLFTGEMAGQWSWLIPLGLIGLAAAAFTLRRRWPLEPKAQQLILWGGWLATYGAVFSIASGIFHPYYLEELTPAAAALVGIGVASLWHAFRAGGWKAWLLPVALFATAIWQTNVLSNYPQWSVWLTPVVIAGSLFAAAGLAALAISRYMNPEIWRKWSPGMVSVGVLALLITPLVWSVTPVLAGPSNASLPVAGPEALNQNDPTSWTRMNGSADSGLVSYLQQNQAGYFYLVAVNNSQQASSIALGTGKPVLAMGGFMGSDPAMTAERLQQLVNDKVVRFVMGGGGRGFGGFGGGTTSVNSWVQANCVAVDPSQYGSGSGFGGGVGGFGGAFGFGNSQLYDCAPNNPSY